MKNDNSYTLITGGTEGIGLELARLFAAEGHSLILVARDDFKMAQAIQSLQQYGVEVVGIQKDLFGTEAAFELYEDISARGLQVDILVNNAGQGQYGEFRETDIRRELSIIQLNISSLVVLTKLFVRDMLSRGKGKILNLSSVASKAPGPLQSVYHGTKAFVQSFTEAIREELKDTSIVITALLPGATDTGFFEKADMLKAKNIKEGKLDDPAKVAKDGFDALMSGDDMVVSGFMNQVQVAMSNVLPDRVAAATVHKQQKPVKGE